MAEPGAGPSPALALVHQGWDHLKLQRPLAAWAAWQRALRLDPENRAAAQAIEVLANAPDLPPAARAVYRFRNPRDEPSRVAWDSALRGKPLADLEEAAAAFRALSSVDPAADYNEALCLAWLGRNRDAIDRLDRFVTRTAGDDFPAAVDAWLLAEVLRQGAGAEELADDVSYSESYNLEAPDSLEAAPEVVAVTFAPGLLPEGAPRAFELLDRPMPEPDRIREAADAPRLLASLAAGGGRVRLSTQSERRWLRARERLVALGLDPAGGPVEIRPLPLPWMDAAAWTVRLPGGVDEDTRRWVLREALEAYYEREWIRIPRKSLNDPADPSPEGRSPVAAAGGDVVARAKLTAVVKMREQLGTRSTSRALYDGYPFDRLRRRLGLDLADPATVDEADITCMGPRELAGLDPATLDAGALAEAYASAAALDDEPLLGRFGPALAALDPEAWADLTARLETENT